MLCSAFLLVCLCVAATAGALSNKPKVVVISLGGIGPNRLEEEIYKKDSPALRKIKATWSGPKSLKPVFPPKGPVNHVSISTGYYAEDHGVINDCVYDELHYKCEYGKPDKSKLPIWIENQKHGGVSGVIDWPGFKKRYGWEKPHYQNSYKGWQSEELIDMMIGWLTSEEYPANLVMMYYKVVDSVLHGVAESSSAGMLHMNLADAFVGNFIQKLEEKNIADDINVIILGSHGVLNVSSDNGIDWRDKFNNKNTKTVKNSIFMGANSIITPSKGNFDEVYNILDGEAQTEGVTKYRVYKNDGIPDEWHLKSALKENDIFVVANRGYFFWNEYLINRFNEYTGRDQPIGVCLGGYPLEPEDDSHFMKTVFMAKGPRIKPGLEVPEFETIDVYPLLRNLLKLPENEKQVKRMEVMNTAVLGLLRDPPSKQQVPETEEEYLRNNVNENTENRTEVKSKKKKELIKNITETITKMKLKPKCCE